MSVLRYGAGTNRNRNENVNSRFASAKYLRLINTETMRVIGTSGNRLIIVRCGGHRCVCGRGVV